MKSICLICKTEAEVDQHHLIPQIWGDNWTEDRDLVIPLCHLHHWMMPPVIRTQNACNIKKVGVREWTEAVDCLFHYFGDKYDFGLLLVPNKSQWTYHIEIMKKTKWKLVARV